MELYRFHEVLYSERRVMLVKSIFNVIKETPTGVWIDYHGTKKFVSLQSHKKFACKSEEEALESFKARKRRQVKILRTQLARAEMALQLTPENDTAYSCIFKEI